MRLTLQSLTTLKIGVTVNGESPNLSDLTICIVTVNG